MTRICKGCHNEFTPKKPHSQYCGTLCSRTALSKGLKGPAGERVSARHCVPPKRPTFSGTGSNSE